MFTAPFSFSIPVTVEFEDVDSYKIAHHTKLIAYLERCRVRFFSHLGFDLNRPDMFLVLYHMNVDFKKPAFFRDELSVAIAVRSFDEYRLVLAYKIVRGNDLIVRASTGLCFVNPVEKTMIAAPDEYVERMRRFFQRNGEAAGP